MSAGKKRARHTEATWAYCTPHEFCTFCGQKLYFKHESPALRYHMLGVEEIMCARWQ